MPDHSFGRMDGIKRIRSDRSKDRQGRQESFCCGKKEQEKADTSKNGESAFLSPPARLTEKTAVYRSVESR